MQDQVPMGVSNRVTDLEKNPQPALYVQRPLIAISIDCLSIDVLCNQKGIAGGGHASVEQMSDVGVVKRSQKLALGLESSEKLRAG
jgi:hypothetical protein